MAETKRSRFKSKTTEKESIDIEEGDLANEELMQPEEETTSKIITDREIAKSALQRRFIVFFILGTFCMLVFNKFTTGQQGLTSVLTLLGVMTLYLVSSLKYSRSIIAKEHFADSFYYMGFIFTFVALTIAMYNLGSATQDATRATLDLVLSQIGIALTTTIYGLVVRVIMIQFNPILSDPDDDILNNIGELANSMEDLAKGFNRSLNTTTSQVQSFHNSLTKDLQKFSETLKNSHNEMLENTLHKINNNLSNFDQTTNLLNNKIEVFAGNLQKLDVKAFGDGMPNLSESLSNLSNSLNHIETSLQSMTQSLQSSSNDLKELSNSVSILNSNAKNAGENFNELNSSASSANTKFSSTNTEYQNLAQNIDEANKKMQEVKRSANTIKSVFEEKTSEIINFLRKKSK